MNEVSLENIKSLKADKLTELLLKLLHLEYKKYLFPDCKIYVPQNITVADGGEDGRIETSDFKTSRWVTDNFCMFQSKATSMSIADCKNEILTTKNDALKKKVKELFESSGTYILFTNDDLVKQNLDSRIEAFREAIESIEGIEFARNAKINIYDANLIRDWTNEYISAVTYVQSCCGIIRPLGLQTWSELYSYRDYSSNFKTNDDISALINSIRNSIFNKEHIRIEGVSGIGKTRLICETFSPSEKDMDGNFDLVRKSLSDSLLYFDLNKGNILEILQFVISTVEKYPAILVLDNCSPEYHNKFLAEVRRTGSLQTLITIDYEKCSLSYDNSHRLIELKSYMFNSVVEEILREKYGNGRLSERDVNYLIEFSEGNPKMAISFGLAAIENRDLNHSFDSDLLEKLIFGREPSKEVEFKVLKICSVFKYFEYPKEELFQLDQNNYYRLLEHIKFLSIFLNINLNDLENILKKYLRKGVLERRGNKIVIRPNPLSLKLSILFWEELNVTQLIPFINEIPLNLRAPLVEQLSQLGGNEKAKTLVESIWGINGNFSSAEILNSDMGSRLFRSVVTVNPNATAKVLTKHYLDKPKEYLMSIVEARQNLVWSLEKLCFREETFIESSKVLMCFAVAEIETYYSNNATYYFTQLFRIYLAGTEANFDLRLNILNWALQKNDKDFNALIIKSCERALAPTHGIHKTLGAENQGGLLPLKDFRPSVKEINSYRFEVLKILQKFAITSNEHQKFAQIVIYSKIYDLFEFKFDIQDLRNIINGFVDKLVDKTDFIKCLYNQLNFTPINDTQKEFLIHFLDKFDDKSIPEQIFFNVSEPRSILVNTNIDRHENEKIIAENFAKKVVSDKIDIKPFFKNLLIGNQFHAFDFGKKLSELSDYNQEFIDELILNVINVEKEKYNFSFFFGFASVLDQSQKNEIFNKLIFKKSLFAFNFFRFINPDLTNISKLINLIKNKDVPTGTLNIITHDVIKLNTADLIIYFDYIKSIENGKLFIIETVNVLLWKLSLADEKLNTEILIYLKSIYEDEKLLIEVNKNQIVDFYSYGKVTKIILDEFGIDICRLISKQIVELFEANNQVLGGHQEIAEIAYLTLNYDFENCWNIYTSVIPENNIFLLWNIFDMSFISDTTLNHPFFVNENRNDKLLDWLLKNKEFAPWIVRVAPLYDESGGNWFSFTEALINFFGDDENFLSELECNLHSMTTWGSRVPYLKSRLKLVEKIQNHKIKKVQEWAQFEIDNYKRLIEIEIIKDEEEYLR